MNISEHNTKFIQEMQRRNYSQNTINNYSSCISYFFGQSQKDHEENNSNIIPLYDNNKLQNNSQKATF